MSDEGLLRIAGASEPQPDKFTSIAFLKFFGGLQTQRSAFASIDTRYNSKFMGGKPDALIAGSNVEISNKLTLQRRPGLMAYGTSNIPAPKAFFDWQLATTGDIILVVDTSSSGGDNSAGANGAVFNYSPTRSGIYINKAALSGQTNFFNVVNTVYLGNGVDLYKIVGPNLLTQSNTFGTGAGTNFSIQSPWTQANVFALTGGQTDPLSTSAATQLIWGTTGATALIEQDVTPNYTPIASNTFTFSLWMKQTGGAISVDLQIKDQSGAIATTTCVLTTSWVKYSVTGTMGAGSNIIKVLLQNPTTTNTMVIYGAQLEVGGPATTTQVTTLKPQGVYLWGITAPTAAPTAVPSATALGNAWLPNHAYQVGDTITDSNGNTQKVTTAGTSGSAQPTWNITIGGTTIDGTQNRLVQTNTTYAVVVGATGISTTLTANVTASNTLLAFVSTTVTTANPAITISDTLGNLWSLVAQSNAGDNHIYLYTVRSAAPGATTVSITATNTGAQPMWLAVSEISQLTGVDVSQTNTARDYVGTIWNTGVVTTTATFDFAITFAAFIGASSSVEIGLPPSGWLPIASLPQVVGGTNNHAQNAGAYCQQEPSVTAVNPAWTVTNPKTPNALMGITAAFKSSVGLLTWTNQAPIGLTAAIGYRYYYSYLNSYTGHPSNVSPASGLNATGTGPVAGQSIAVAGATRTMTNSGAYSVDPQSDAIAIYRNTDGGPFYYQLGIIGNGTAAQAALAAANFTNLLTAVTFGSGTWTVTDTTPDTSLTTTIFAPIALLNSVPPAGLVNLEYFAGRMWGSVANLLYYNSGPDNAALLGITQNAVPSEAWAPANVIPFNAPIVRSVAIGGGLLVFTTTDTWFVTGQNILTGGFNPTKILVNHGVRSYNAVGVDGSSVCVYTSDRQCLIMNPNSGSIEYGYPIGDTLEATFLPGSVYFVRHVAGSQDNAIYLADGSTGWYRLNPNQQGATMQGEATPVWSPKATITDGIGAIASMETSAGVIQLLVGRTSVGPVLVRSLTTFSDNGAAYTWSATIGSILLTTPGKLAEVESITTEMNNVSSAATQCAVAVLLDEISGSFETLANSVNDPPQLATSTSVLSKRFYLSQGAVPPICRHMQIQLSGSAVTTKDETLALTVRGALCAEQV